jgi:hypothetical protein
VSTPTVETEELLRASRAELLSAAVLAISKARPAVSAQYLDLAGSLAALLVRLAVERAVDSQTVYLLADRVERAGDRAAHYGWDELDDLDTAVSYLLELADTVERSGL